MRHPDSRDEPMPPMSFSQALERVFALAAANLPDEHDVAREPALAADARVQSAALATVGDLLETGSGEMDARFAPPTRNPSSDGSTPDDMEGDPSLPSDAVRMVLRMAEHVPSGEALDERALELVAELAASHGAALDEMVAQMASPSYR